MLVKAYPHVCSVQGESKARLGYRALAVCRLLSDRDQIRSCQMRIGGTRQLQVA